MKKRIYRAVEVKSLNLEEWSRQLPGDRWILGVDVAKDWQYGVLMGEGEAIVGLVKWRSKESHRRVASWLGRLGERVSVAMEPSGTYGDTLRWLLYEEGVAVYQVLPKQVSDAKEIYDGVPSSHDAKAAAIIAWLHQLGRSRRWPAQQASARELRSGVRMLSLHDGAFRRGQCRLEAQLARHWPEVGQLLDLDSATLLELLAHYGSPAAVAADLAAAEQLMESVSRGMLAPEKIEAVLQSAQQTLGVPMIAAEIEEMQGLAQETRRQQRAALQAHHALERISRADSVMRRLGQQIGLRSAAILVQGLGPLEQYPSCRACLKAAGMNLKIRSSGRRKGQLALTKRGATQVRQYLYLATLRWIQKDPIAYAWYQRKIRRDGGLKRKALIALMRKLLCGLWWVARGEPFDSTKLFEIHRLQIAQESNP